MQEKLFDTSEINAREHFIKNLSIQKNHRNKRQLYLISFELTEFSFKKLSFKKQYIDTILFFLKLLIFSKK